METLQEFAPFNRALALTILFALIVLIGITATMKPASLRSALDQPAFEVAVAYPQH